MIRKNSLIRLLLLLCLYLPFEDFLLKWLPVSETVYGYFRQIPDLAVGFLLIAVFLTDLSDFRLKIIDRKIFFFIAGFVLFAFVSLWVNKAPAMNSVLNLKALVRYILVLFILYNLKPTEKQTTLFIRIVMAVAFVQATLGILQYAGGSPVRDFFKPRALTRFGMKLTALTQGSDEVFGTMARTIDYSFFLLIGLVFWILFGGTVVRRGVLAAGSLYLLLAIFLSGSRAAVFTALICLFLSVYFLRGIKTSAVLTGLLTVFVSPYLVFFASLADFGSSNRSFLYFLSSSYLKNLQHQRLGIIEYFMVPYLRDRHLLYGLGPDSERVVSYMFQKFNIPAFLNVYGQRILEDVYWVALLLYYGLLGLILFVLFLLFVYRKLGSYQKKFAGDFFRSRLIVASKILLITLVPLNITNQAFEVRQFSFYLWALIGFAFYVLAFPEERESQSG